MQCKVFSGHNVFETIDKFNYWAKGRQLTREVIIHTLHLSKHEDGSENIAIVVYCPEGKEWDTTVAEPKVQKIDVSIPFVEVGTIKV